MGSLVQNNEIAMGSLVQNKTAMGSLVQNKTVMGSLVQNKAVQRGFSALISWSGSSSIALALQHKIFMRLPITGAGFDQATFRQQSRLT
jgi:hypothetical protein